MDGTRSHASRRGRGADLAVAYALVAPLALGAVAAFAASPQFSFLAQNFTPIWAGAVLIFLAGALRSAGPGLAISLALFAAGAATLFCVVWGYPLAATLIPAFGFAGTGAAAGRSLAGLRFGAVQIAIAAVAMLVLAARAGGYL